MNRKRVNRIIKTITSVVGVETLLVYDMHNYEWRGHAPLSWSEIFLDRTFWISLIIITIHTYCCVCYMEYKQDEQEYKRKKHDENEEEEDEDEDDT